jgi:4-amino-4-deoxy-L-arabinose transferase-like glycosyltransferase
VPGDGHAPSPELRKRLRIARFTVLGALLVAVIPSIALDPYPRSFFILGWALSCIVFLSISVVSEASLRGKITRRSSRIAAALIGATGITMFFIIGQLLRK